MVSVHRKKENAEASARKERDRLQNGYGSMVPMVRLAQADYTAKKGDVVKLWE